MKVLVSVFALAILNTGFSQEGKVERKGFDLVVRIDYLLGDASLNRNWFNLPISVTGKVQNNLDKITFGDEVELIFERPGALYGLTKGGVYRLRVQFLDPLLDVKDKVASDSFSIIKSKLVVLEVKSIVRKNTF